MTIEEAKNFYKQDNKEYILTSKNIIAKWIKDIIELEKIDLENVKYPENYGLVLKNTIKKIYDSLLNIKDLQNLIDFITVWYEIKYPNNEFEYYNLNLNKEKLSRHMNINELINRLNDDEKDIMLCYYRAHGWSCIPIIINKKIISNDSIFFSIDIKKEKNGFNNNYSIMVNADYVSGLINLPENKELKEIIDDKYFKQHCITLDELYCELKKSNLNINYCNLKEIILDRNLRLKIRKEILELVELKLLYSENTIPEYGYERAKRFINEFNKKLNTNLTTDKIDKIMNKDYKNIKKLTK